MTREDCEALVQRLEGYAKAHPGRYAIRVGALAGLGYAYVWVVLAIATLLLIGLIRLELMGVLRVGMLQITLALGLLVYATLRALWVRFERPVGIPVGHDDAPALMALVDELVADVQAHPFDEVVVSGDFNAAVTQLPRFGLLGGYHNSLVVGLPLAHALTAEEFRAVLAHEVAHLSRAHGRFAAWIYRVRGMWTRLTEQLQARRTWGAWLFEWFLKRWSPYFSAYSFVLARAQEREADRFAVRAAGADALARALMKLEVITVCIEGPFWDQVRHRVADEPEPPVGVLSEFVAAVRAPVPHGEVARRLTHALGRRTWMADTHPSLSERLESMGHPAAQAGAAAGTLVAPGIGASAADRYFAAGGHDLLALLDGRWREMVRAQWSVGHETARDKVSRLAELDQRAAAGTLDTGLSWERAELTLDLHGEASAEPLLRDLLQGAPDHPFANLALGALLLDRDDDAGLAMVHLALGHAACRLEGYALLIDYLDRQGRRDEAKGYWELASSYRDQLAYAALERKGVDNTDQLVSHELGAEAAGRLTERLSAIPDIREAYLARKELQEFPEVPQYVLGVVLAGPWYRSASSINHTLQRIEKQVPFSEDCLVVVLDDRTAGIADQLKRIPGARLLPR